MAYITTRFIRLAFLTGCSALLGLGSTAPAVAFDTGHHYDLTEDAMRDRGFSSKAYGIAQVANWLTDYYEHSPANQYLSIKEHTRKLHFDNLLTTSQVRNYWAHLVVNTHDAIQDAVRRNDPLRALVLMGISLHAVQDFYTHSNWVETHPSDAVSYRTETWFSTPPNSSNVYTGISSSFVGQAPANHPSHGSYANGLNKDSYYMKPNWEHAYTFAYVASREWINAIKAWVEQESPGFWRQMQTIEISSFELGQDLGATYRLSEWVEEGHWKGKGSGDPTSFLAHSLTWLGLPDGAIVEEFKNRTAYRAISNNLTGAQPPTKPIPVVPSLPLSHRAVIIRTLNVKESSTGYLETRIDPGADPDYYARVKLFGQTFTEATQMDKSSIKPFWTSIKFVPLNVSVIEAEYRLIDEDGFTKNDVADINPKNGRALNFDINLNANALTGDLLGPLGIDNALTVNGNESDKAKVTIAVIVKNLRPAPDCRTSRLPRSLCRPAVDGMLLPVTP